MQKKTTAKAKKPSSNRKTNGKDFLVVGMGASAGGVKALQDFFSSMPPNSDMSFVVVLHLLPEHESNLAAVLQTHTSMPVMQVTKSTKVEPNQVYVVPPNHQLQMVDGVVQCVEPDTKWGSRVAIDVFFRTLAEAYERNAVCIVLSGTGSDGTLGLKTIKEKNGFAIVQSPEDAEYDAMPRSAIATNLADWVLPVAQMPEKLIAFRQSSERLHLTDGDDDRVAREIKGEESLREILTLLRVRTGHDFSNYKTPTLIRRIARHLQIHELEDIPSYLAFLRENPEEIQSLLRNLLINVTNFFRDKEAFDVLETKIIPQLFAGKHSKDTIRAWVAACASGEEAYSIAMLLSEFANRLSDPPKIQVFASDVDEEAINEARAHRYPETITADVSPERIRHFFVKEGKYYRIKKVLRETVLFAPHNLLRDPPFSRLDFISCRNLLIYLNRDTQDKLLEIFHFALIPHGFLFLGSSESAESVTSLFAPVDKKHRIYSRRPTQQHAPFTPPTLPIAGRWQVTLPETKQTVEGNKRFTLGEVHYKLLEKYAPPSILLNQDFDIIYMSESAGRFLRFSGGEPSNNLLKMINPDLLPDLRAALFSAQHDRKIAEFQNIRVVIDNQETTVNLIVRTVDVDDETSDFLLVIFDENKTLSVVEDKENKKSTRVLDKDEAMETVVRRLEEDLRRTKEHLHTTIEQHETSVEELKASNEELQAINEELRSASEELETSKEELQSVNEELITVNQELKEKIDETSRANSDLQNLMASTDIATIFLDRDLHIKRYTPPAQKLFNITLTDIGRPLEHFTSNLKYESLSQDATEVLHSWMTLEREIEDKHNRVYLARIIPYRTVEDHINGVVLNFVEITEGKKAERELRVSEERFRRATEIDTIGIVFFKNDGSITETNDAFLRMSGYTREDFQKGLVRWSDMIAKESMQHSIDSDKEFETTGRSTPYEKQYIRKDGSRWWALFASTRISDIEGVEFIIDITDKKRTEEELTESRKQLRLIMESVSDHAIITLDNNNIITSWNKGAEKIFGFHREEAIGKSGEIIFTIEDRKNGIPQKEIKTAIRKGRAEDERWHMRKDGSRFFASGVMSPLKNGVNGFVKITRDQTAQLLAQSTLQEREILRRLVTAQEDERRRIARDIHDQLGQQVTSIQLKLESIRNLAAKDKAMREQIDEAQSFVERLDRDVDFIAWELRPAALDDLGLRATLSNFIKEWSRHTGIGAEFHTSGLSRLRLDFEIETNLYRIAQESLNNIYKHAKATNVSVLLEKRGDKIILIVEDDGVGFNTKNKKFFGKGMGLIGMQERAKILGGTLDIESQPQTGTTIFANVPAKLMMEEILKTNNIKKKPTKRRTRK